MHQLHKIRKSVFETNSSSSHSLTMSATDLTPQPFSSDVLRAGVIQASKGEYGWEWHRYYTAASKLDYLLTQLFNEDIPNGSASSVTRELREENGDFDRMCRVVQEHTGVTLEVSPGSSGYIDHQSVGVGMEVFATDDALRDFLFSRENYIETGNDNSGPGFTITTDVGSMDYFEDFYWTPPATHVDLKLTLVKDWGMQFKTEKGALLDLQYNSGVMDLLRAKATLASVHWVCKGRWYRFEHEDARGSTASLFADKVSGLRFLRDMNVTTEFTKSDDSRDDTAQLTLKVPQELADLVNSLTETLVVEAKVS